MREITDKGLDASVKEKNQLTVLKSTNKMLEQGFKFGMIGLYKSDAANSVIEGDTLTAPSRAILSLGTSVARQVVEARKGGPFLSEEDLATRGKISRALIEYMNDNGILKDLPDEDRLLLSDTL